MSRLLLATSVAVLLAGGPALAADDRPLPPSNAKKLSEILAKSKSATAFCM
ncbi:hypothetical protein [Mesorhizobium sp.]|uniref:hypothetical protein n=1 Tax=Mesorhizobium sp. TaxID=1871066 RepID=UPI0025B7F34D|nr:hypothetical protein [Mesorhizobium sp.]